MVPPHHLTQQVRPPTDGAAVRRCRHRMIPTHATKAGVRYRYYVSTPVLHGEAKTVSAGSVSRVPAGDIEDTVVKSLKEHRAPNRIGSTRSVAVSVTGWWRWRWSLRDPLCLA